MTYTLRLGLILVWLAVFRVVVAQSDPIIEVQLHPAAARSGAHVLADVYVRNAAAVYAMDIGITVDERCLKIVRRRDGSSESGNSQSGGFAPFSILNDHDTRYAASLGDALKTTSGEGLFYQVELEVTCEIGLARIAVSHAELSALNDAPVQATSVVTYRLSDHTLHVLDAAVEVRPDAPEVVGTPSGRETVFLAAGAQVSRGNNELRPVLIVVAVSLVIVASGMLAFVFRSLRRRATGND